MIGTLINVAMILAGAAVGLLLRKGIPGRIQETVMKALGLCTLLIGLSGAMGLNNHSQSIDTLCVIVCMAAGSIVGSAVNIELKLNRLGQWFEKKLARGDTQNDLAKGFVSASLLYCVGAMAIVGAINSGIRGDHSTLIAKGIMDGVSAIFFTSAMGIGVALSALAVFVYQGAIALLASALAPMLSDLLIAHISAVGGLLVAAIGLNLIREKQIPVGNMLPAIFLPLVYLPVAALFG